MTDGDRELPTLPLLENHSAEGVLVQSPVSLPTTPPSMEVRPNAGFPKSESLLEAAIKELCAQNQGCAVQVVSTAGHENRRPESGQPASADSERRQRGRSDNGQRESLSARRTSMRQSGIRESSVRPSVCENVGESGPPVRGQSSRRESAELVKRRERAMHTSRRESGRLSCASRESSILQKRVSSNSRGPESSGRGRLSRGNGESNVLGSRDKLSSTLCENSRGCSRLHACRKPTNCRS